MTDFEYLVPQALPQVRTISREDAPLLARWIEQGRREGVVRSGDIVSPAPVLDYQESQQQEGWDYRCLIIENDSGPIGYLESRAQPPLGEVLGLYLDPACRGQRLGRHLLGWAVADLRERGCREIRVEIHADNAASLHVAGLAGFRPTTERVEDGRCVHVLGRRIPPFRRFTPCDPAYAHVQGENLFLHHVALAEVLVRQVRRRPCVEAIVGLGSLGRGFADRWSDIDLAILGRGTGLRRLPHGERWLAGTSIDFYVVDLDRSPPAVWDESRRQALGEGVVLFARGRDLLRSLRRVLRLGARERKHLIRELVLKIGWLGFEPRSWYNQVRCGYLWSLPHDLWLQRGDLASAHATVDQALGHAFELLFVLNGRLVPDLKWRRFLVAGLPWLPADFASLLQQAEQPARDRAGFSMRAEAVLAIIERTLGRLEEAGELGEDLYRAFLRSSPDYNPGA
jgi:GNAT superfamily N-acetyltransferase